MHDLHALIDYLRQFRTLFARKCFVLQSDLLVEIVLYSIIRDCQ